MINLRYFHNTIPKDVERTAKKERLRICDRSSHCELRNVEDDNDDDKEKEQKFHFEIIFLVFASNFFLKLR